MNYDEPAKWQRNETSAGKRQTAIYWWMLRVKTSRETWLRVYPFNASTRVARPRKICRFKFLFFKKITLLSLVLLFILFLETFFTRIFLFTRIYFNRDIILIEIIIEKMFLQFKNTVIMWSILSLVVFLIIMKNKTQYIYALRCKRKKINMKCAH